MISKTNNKNKQFRIIIFFEIVLFLRNVYLSKKYFYICHLKHIKTNKTMKKLIFAAVAVLSITTGFSQKKTTEGFGKGNLFVSGTMSVNSSKEEDFKSNSLTFSPKVGYFVSDNIALGLGIGYETGELTEGGTTAAENKVFMANLFGRVYATPASKFSLFTQLNIGFGNSETEYTQFMGEFLPFETNYSTFNIGFAPGFHYFVNDNLGLETTVGVIGYNAMKNKDTDTKTNSFNVGLDFSNINFGIIYKF